jgi:hypothetical protein
MGREALTRAEIGEETGEVRVLLESSELILRGGIRRRFPRETLADVRVEAGALRFNAGGETVILHLGVATAAAWAKAIAAAPPSLKAKLGLAKGARALCVGRFDDTALDEAVAGSRVEDIGSADMIIARIDRLADLAAALAAHAHRSMLPLWAVYPKGRGTAFGDFEIRERLRCAGFRDSKSCAVSDRLTATRYGRR